MDTRISQNGTGGTAFPVGTERLGLTKRDYFAAAALEGLLSRGTAWRPEEIAARVYEYADAILKARSE